MGLRRREHILLSVDRPACAAEDEAFYVGHTAGFQQVEKSYDVDIGVESGIGNRPPNVHLCSEMADNIGTFFSNDLCRCFGSNVEFYQSSTVVKIGRFAGREIVECDDLVARIGERSAHMRTDESSAPCYYDFHVAS
jgi:hypothetical protein